MRLVDVIRNGEGLCISGDLIGEDLFFFCYYICYFWNSYGEVYCECDFRIIFYCEMKVEEGLWKLYEK